MTYPDVKKPGMHRPLTEEGAEMLMKCFLLKDDFEVPPGDELPFLSQVVQKRIVKLKLPIRFTARALMAVNAFAWNPGSAVVLLCDCLAAYEGKSVDLDELVAIYPWGFYNQSALETVIDQWMKTKKHKWAWVY